MPAKSDNFIGPGCICLPAPAPTNPECTSCQRAEAELADTIERDRKRAEQKRRERAGERT